MNLRFIPYVLTRAKRKEQIKEGEEEKILAEMKKEV